MVKDVKYLVAIEGKLIKPRLHRLHIIKPTDKNHALETVKFYSTKTRAILLVSPGYYEKHEGVEIQVLTDNGFNTLFNTTKKLAIYDHSQCIDTAPTNGSTFSNKFVPMHTNLNHRVVEHVQSKGITSFGKPWYVIMDRQVLQPFNCSDLAKEMLSALEDSNSTITLLAGDIENPKEVNLPKYEVRISKR